MKSCDDTTLEGRGNSILGDPSGTPWEEVKEYAKDLATTRVTWWEPDPSDGILQNAIQHMGKGAFLSRAELNLGISAMLQEMGKPEHSLRGLIGSDPSECVKEAEELWKKLLKLPTPTNPPKRYTVPEGYEEAKQWRDLGWTFMFNGPWENYWAWLRDYKKLSRGESLNRPTAEDFFPLVRQAERELASGKKIGEVCRELGTLKKTYYHVRKKLREEAQALKLDG